VAFAVLGLPEALLSMKFIHPEMNSSRLKLIVLLISTTASGALVEGALLAPWVGPNIRLGTDPVELPAGEAKNQAEPHAIRSITDPDLILATFQEGRYPDGGARNNGYAVSEDGGFTWNRRLNPRLTLVSQGPYFRATDPVGGINREGHLFLNSLVSVDAFFNRGRLVVQRSTDRGQTWTNPITVYSGTYTSESNSVFPDKNWMVVNDYPDEPTTDRIVVTWTDFRVIMDGVRNIQDFLIMSSFSDDNGNTWSSPAFVTPPGSTTNSSLQYQGSQPVFLPGGGLAIVYHNFLSTRLEVRYSPDGGESFPFGPTLLHSGYILYDLPNMRDGSFLPSVGVARDTGDLYVAYTSKDFQIGGKGYIYFVRSERSSPVAQGSQNVNWNFRAPIKALTATPRQVSTPTLSVTPDGQRVTIYFYDNRNGSGVNDSGDFYAVQSIDGGTTWSTAFRLTEETFDLDKATETSRGFMIGDYFGFAPPLGPDQAGVAVWVDTRDATADPWGARIGGLEGTIFNTWLQANLPYAARSAGEEDLRYADPDKDGTPALMEYVLGLSPHLPESMPDFSNGLTHLRLDAGTDPLTQVTVRGGTGRWPMDQVVSGINPVEALFGERFWRQLTWDTGGELDHLEFTVNGTEDWFLLDESAPVRWVREEPESWVWSPWFGFLYTDFAPWLFHFTLGWVYDFEGVLYSPALSVYLYPSPEIHPWMYRQGGSFVYLLEGTPWVYDMASGSWVQTY
jgi:hypothetical protein